MNLIEEFPPMPPMDIVFLRNVLIYFDIETKRAILDEVKRVLAPRRVAVPRRRGDDLQHRPAIHEVLEPALRLLPAQPLEARLP